MTNIRNDEQFTQKVDFDGLQYGTISPTDIDGIIDYHGKAWVILEFKFLDAEMPTGQRLCIERMANAFRIAGQKVIAIYAMHFDETPHRIRAAKARVKEIYYRGKWTRIDYPLTVKEVIDKFIAWADEK